MLNLFYITNNPQVATIADCYGVDRIWIDLETLGKADRQKGFDSVKSDHCIADISVIKPLLTKAKMLVRVNPWNDSSSTEIEAVIRSGADLIMLPMWKSPSEVEKFLTCIDGRTKTVLLLETKEAVACIDTVLKMSFDEIHIGLNDLHLSLGETFLFEPLANGMIDTLCQKFHQRGIPYGFGGIARLGYGLLPAEKVIMEHYRLGSTRAILSRSFCNIKNCKSLNEIERLFCENMKKLCEYEQIGINAPEDDLQRNRCDVQQCVATIVNTLKKQRHAT